MILLIDDEDIIRTTVKRLLENSGYDVLVAEDGVSGIDMYRAHKQSIHLIILDMSMRTMSGKETFVALKKINPEIKVIISSGFKTDNTIKETLQNGAVDFIPKPFTYTELIKTVKKHVG